MRTVLAVIVKDGEVLAYERNLPHECKREGYPTGEGYALCEGCWPKNHAERRVLNLGDFRDAILYLFGHTYACELCKEACAKSGVQLKIMTPPTSPEESLNKP